MGIAKQLIKAGFRMAGLEVRRGPHSQAFAPASQAGQGKLLPEAPSYGDLVRWCLMEFTRSIQQHEVELVLDVGANTGQFGAELRSVGYEGQIVSFEPLSAAHGQLAQRARGDARWTVAPRAAVGEAAGVAEINIAGNSYSSSLLPMLDKHVHGAPQSAYTGTESCPIITLDDYLDRHAPACQRIGLKVDTQGYEQHVLRGVERHLPRVCTVVLEISLSPLYGHAPSFEQLHRRLTDAGLLCRGLFPEFTDPTTGELLQVNGLYGRRPSAAGRRVA